MMIDTGMSGAVIGKALAERLSLPTVPSTGTLRGLHSVRKQKVEVASKVTINVSETVQIENASLVSDFSLFPAFASRHIDGILGSALFLLHVVTIDYSTHQLLIDDHRPTSEGDIILTFDRRKLPIVLAQVDGRKEKFLLDTGSDGGVELNFWCAQKYAKALANRRQISGAYEDGMDGRLPYEEASLKAFRIANRTYPDLEITISGDAKGAGGRSIAGKIGNAFLSRFASVTVDYAHSRIVLHP